MPTNKPLRDALKCRSNGHSLPLKLKDALSTTDAKEFLNEFSRHSDLSKFGIFIDYQSE